MRRSVLLVPALIALIALIGPASSAQTEGETATLNITKVVDGDGPTGGYVIEYACVPILEPVSPGSEGASGGALNFDAAAPGSPETQTVVLDAAGDCTITETDSNGAVSVVYECEFIDGGIGNSPDGAFAEAAEGFFGRCLDDQTARIASPGDVASFTVTNTFEADVIDEEEEPPAVDDDVVDATPSFTG